jgi:hypothetical protein
VSLRIKKGASVVDHLIVNILRYCSLNTMEVLDFNEFSDHFAVEFSLNCDLSSSSNNTIIKEDKLV